MKKYFNLSGLRTLNLGGLLSKFVILFLIIPSLTLPQFAWAATADVDRMVVNPMRAAGLPVADLYGDTTVEDDIPVQPSCLQRWSIRISRWWYGTPQTPFTPASSAVVEMVDTSAAAPAPATAKRKASVYRVFHPDDVDSKDGAPRSLAALGLHSLDAMRDGDSKGDSRASFAPQQNTNAVMNPLALAKHVRNGAAVGTEAIVIPAEDRGSPPSDPESTAASSSTGSDSPPQAGVAKNPLHAAALRDEAWSEEEDVEKGEPVARALATTLVEPDGAAHIRSIHERLTTLLKSYVVKSKADTAVAADQEEINRLLQGYKSENISWKPGDAYPELRKALEAYHIYQTKSKPKLATGVTPPEDPNEKGRKELIGDLKALETGKAFNEFMLKLFNPETTKRVWGQRLATFILSGFLGYELRGEWGILIDKTLSALSTSKPFFYYMYYSNEGMSAMGRVNEFLRANTAISLSPYIPKRTNLAVQRMTSEPEERAVKKTIPVWATVVGAVVTTIAALGNAGVPAYSTYEKNILFAETSLYAKSVPLFLLAFNFLDQKVRLETLMDRVFTKIFVNRGSPYAQDRIAIVEQLRAAKRVIYKMDPAQVLALDSDLMNFSRRKEGRGATTEELLGLKQYQKLAVLGKDAPKIAASKKLKSYIRRYGPMALASIIALGGAYLSYTTAQQSATNAYKYLATNIPDYSLYETTARYTAEIYQEQMGQRDYELWQTSLGGAVYDGFGNGTDWCSKCFLGSVYDYPLTDPGYEGCSYIWFYGCPGTQPKYYLFNKTAGEFDYAPISCNNFFGIVDTEHRDAPTDAYYTLALQLNAPWLLDGGNSTSYEVPTAGKAIAGTVASISALATYGLGAVNAINFFKRWMDSFSSKPYEAMPGKQNRIYSAISMPLAAIESVFRASPVAITAWLATKDSGMDPGLMWTILVAATFTNAATYFPDFDDTYSSLPRWAQKTWAWAKQTVKRITGRKFKEEDLVNVKKDELLLKVDEMIRIIAMADDSVIKTLKKA